MKRKSTLFAIVALLLLTLFPRLIVNAASVTITYRYTEGRVTPGTNWKDSEAVQTGAFYIDASKDNNRIRRKRKG